MSLFKREKKSSIIFAEKIPRQVQISRPHLTVTLVTEHPKEDMDYLVKKAKNLIKVL